VVDEGDGDAVEGGEVGEVYGSWEVGGVRKWLVGQGLREGLVTVEGIDACSTYEREHMVSFDDVL
jgi:hypothetical protein